MDFTLSKEKVITQPRNKIPKARLIFPSFSDFDFAFRKKSCVTVKDIAIAIMPITVSVIIFVVSILF